MKLADAKSAVEQIDLNAGQDLIYELLSAYGIAQASITRLRSGDYNQSSEDHVVIWKKKVWDIYLPDATDIDLIAALDAAQARPEVRRVKPRFFIARSDTHMAAVDARQGQTLTIKLADLAQHAAFFLPWAKVELVRTEIASQIDRKVADQMKSLYDEIIKENKQILVTEDSRADLNTFFSRLLFCFFAEDTGVFEDGLFTDTIHSVTAKDGADTAKFLSDLFDVLNQAPEQREGLDSEFEPFGYVNGSLFAGEISVPDLSRKARNIVVDCGSLDWSDINPDIFGSMIQAVTAGEDRANLGMHYTSVENILKVLNPLFLDGLEEQFEAAHDSAKQLQKLLDHLAEVRVFDPACGSGNFLIVAYKRLRRLEHQILQRIAELTGKPPLFAESKISLEHFYGIEIDGFAHDIAKLSLWFAKHQMNQEYDELFGYLQPLIPLTETGAIVNANAAEADWTEVCEPRETTYICGNPPFLGAKYHQPSHKADFATYFAEKKYPKNLDYISIWFLKAADFLVEGQGGAALVSTNSVCQGQHVGLLWPLLFERGVLIDFAHTSFDWSNNAVGGAGVTCIVIGLSKGHDRLRRLFSDQSVRLVPNINPYLVPSEDNTIVANRRNPLCSVPAATLGSMAKDGKHLSLTAAERQSLLDASPEAGKFVKPYLGSKELINAQPRFCLWIEDDKLAEAKAIAGVSVRLDKVKAFRSASKDRDASKFDDRPHRFVQRAFSHTSCIGIPGVSSDRREYIPMGWFSPGTVLSYLAFAVYEAEPWVLAILQTSMHTAWVRTIGGKMRDAGYRYSNTLCYNTFPFPEINSSRREALEDSALEILAARERWPDRSLAELYDPDKMPANLRAAHEANDALVDSLYREKPFGSDVDRMELLLAMYRDLVAEDDEKKSKKGKG